MFLKYNGKNNIFFIKKFLYLIKCIGNLFYVFYFYIMFFFYCD